MTFGFGLLEVYTLQESDVLPTELMRQTHKIEKPNTHFLKSEILFNNSWTMLHQT